MFIDKKNSIMTKNFPKRNKFLRWLYFIKISARIPSLFVFIKLALIKKMFILRIKNQLPLSSVLTLASLNQISLLYNIVIVIEDILHFTTCMYMFNITKWVSYENMNYIFKMHVFLVSGCEVKNYFSNKKLRERVGYYFSLINRWW